MNYINFHQQRTFTEVLNSTFVFIRQNFVPLLKYLLIIVGPLLGIIMVIILLVQIKMLSIVTGSGESSTIFLGMDVIAVGIISSILIAYFAGFVLYGTVSAYVSLYTEYEGHNFNLADVWSRVTSNLPTLLSATFYLSLILLLLAIAIAYGSIFVMMFMLTASWLIILLLFCTPLIVTGLYGSVIFSILFTVSLQERLSLGDAIIRSFSLVRGSWWQTAGILVLLLLITTLIAYIFSLPTWLLTNGNFFFTTLDATLLITTVVISMVVMVANYVVYIIPIVGMIIQYHNLVERKEAPGLMERVHTMTGLDSSNEGSPQSTI